MDEKKRAIYPFNTQAEFDAYVAEIDTYGAELKARRNLQKAIQKSTESPRSDPDFTSAAYLPNFPSGLVS